MQWIWGEAHGQCRQYPMVLVFGSAYSCLQVLWTHPPPFLGGSLSRRPCFEVVGKINCCDFHQGLANSPIVAIWKFLALWYELSGLLDGGRGHKGVI